MPRPSLAWLWSALAVVALALLYYAVVCWLRGDGEWRYVDFVALRNVYWGDDAYRWFLARSAWWNPDLYWFNFSLPGWLVLDGVIATLSDGDLLQARLVKALLCALSILLVYRTGRRLLLSRQASLLAAALLATLPLYALVGMSFYGEAWAAVLVSLALFLATTRFRQAMLLLVGFLPLVRPEAIAFVGGFVLLGLRRRALREIALPVLPGFCYFLAVLLAAPDAPAFLRWRVELASLLRSQGQFYGWGGASILDVFVLPWAACAVAGMFMPKARPLAAFYIGTVIAVAITAKSIADNEGFLEPRYYVPFLPVVAIGFAVFLDGARDHAAGRWLQQRSGGAWQWALVALVFVLQAGTLTTLRAALALGLSEGAPLRYLSTDPARGGRLFSLSPLEKAQLQEFAGVVTRMVQMNPDVKTLMVNNVQVFYFLDPAALPRDLRVVVAVLSRAQLAQLLKADEAVGYFAAPPYFGRFRLGDPRMEQEKILYLDTFPLPDYPFHWRVGGSRFGGPNDIYLFGGGLVP